MTTNSLPSSPQEEKHCECVGCTNGERCTKEIRIDVAPQEDTPTTLEGESAKINQALLDNK